MKASHVVLALIVAAVGVIMWKANSKGTMIAAAGSSEEQEPSVGIKTCSEAVGRMKILDAAIQSNEYSGNELEKIVAELRTLYRGYDRDCVDRPIQPSSQPPQQPPQQGHQSVVHSR